MSATRRWVVVAALAVVVVLAAGWLLVVKPQQSKVSSLNSQTATQNQANALLVTQIAALQSEFKTLPQEQLRLQKFSTQIPDSPAEPTLIRQLQAAANRSNVDLISITPAAPVAVSPTAAATGTTGLGAAPATTETLYSLAVSLGVVGAYSDVELFFSTLEKLPRAVVVTGFTLCPTVAGGIGSSCTGPQEPTNKQAPPNSVSAALTTSFFFAPPVAPPTTSTTQTLTTPAAPGTTATTPAAGTTPVATPSDTTSAPAATS